MLRNRANAMLIDKKRGFIFVTFAKHIIQQERKYMKEEIDAGKELSKQLDEAHNAEIVKIFLTTKIKPFTLWDKFKLLFVFKKHISTVSDENGNSYTTIAKKMGGKTYIVKSYWRKHGFKY